MEVNGGRVEVTLQHYDGVKFNVFLTNYELTRCEEDENFKAELITKYHNLYQNGLLFGSNGGSRASATPGTEPGTESQAGPSSERSQGIDEEMLITAVASKPVLYNFKLPLQERGREVVKRKWEEVIEELNMDTTVDAVSKKWKNIRDSYLRAKGNIRKKIASGASATQKLEAEKIRRNHKNFDLLQFLDDVSFSRSTTSNLTPEDPLTTPASSASSVTPSTSESNTELSNADKAFFETLKSINTEANQNSNQTSMSATQHFCMRLADSLERLPRNVRNRIEIKILQIVCDAEEEQSAA